MERVHVDKRQAISEISVIFLNEVFIDENGTSWRHKFTNNTDTFSLMNKSLCTENTSIK